jgi:glycosyltransferase involved in cell wall biosynthesis
MNIGIDITSLIYERGVSRYTSNLIKALLRKKHINLSLYGSSFRQKNFLEEKAKKLLNNKIAGTKQQTLIQSYPPTVLSFLWKFGFNSIDKIMPPLDVFHSWDWLQPAIKDIPLVSTIHDVAILKFPETAHPRVVKAHQLSWKILKDKQAHIIAVSHATKKDIVNILQIPPYLIHVIHEALPTDIKDVSDNLDEDHYKLIKEQLQLNKPFIFFVGTREPRKNLLRLIQAWQPMSKNYQLIIAGESGWDETSSKKDGKAKFNQDDPNLRFLGKVSNRQLSVLYGEASLFVYPSLYEGFGLPILEAFHHGTPVVTSNISSMIEVAGNAAELVNPESIDDIHKGIKNILGENIEDQQKRLQRMIIRLQMFSWEKVATETIRVYQQAIKDWQERDSE